MKFVKGQSGNPGGRPRECEEVKRLARQYTEEAILKLAQVMREGNARDAAMAANALLDRGYGKPAQTQILNGDEDGGPVQINKIERSIFRVPHPEPPNG